MKTPTSRHVALTMLAALFGIISLFVLCCLGAGCSTVREDAATAAGDIKSAVSNYDRNYSASYDVTDHGYAAGVTIRPAARPGAGNPSLSLDLTGHNP